MTVNLGFLLDADALILTGLGPFLELVPQEALPSPHSALSHRTGLASPASLLVPFSIWDLVDVQYVLVFAEW